MMGRTPKRDVQRMAWHSRDNILLLPALALILFGINGDPYGTRTRVASVKGMCPNR